MKKNFDTAPALVSRITSRVRFSELDPMQIVWHGNYVRYFEDGRQHFGEEYSGLGYMDMYSNGYTAPLVELNVEYLKPLGYHDSVIIETRYIRCDAAKIIFEYCLYREADNSLVCRGRTVQAFVDLNGALQLNNPEFYLEWKRKWNIE
ncbi:MAG: acyl-CoA thioesterase [Bacteroidales bacterium]|nr:acyl-CoA thioesterase [Bacteroidales bacterium]